MLEFHPIHKYILKREDGSVWVVYTGKNPVKCWDFDHLIGHYIIIDDCVRKVMGVEKFLHLPPYRKGENIGIGVIGHKDIDGEWE